MLMLSDFCFSKERREVWSVGCGSTGCDASNEWSFGGPNKKWYVKLPAVYLIILGSTLYFPKTNLIIRKTISP